MSLYFYWYFISTNSRLNGKKFIKEKWTLILVNDLFVFSRPTMYCSFVLNSILLYVHTIISMKAPKVQVQNLGQIATSRSKFKSSNNKLKFKIQVQVQNAN
jgi:hypothetical protein